jgi:hypothetical protein
MTTKKLSYWVINSLLSFIDGKREGEKLVILGLANEAITSGVAIRLARIKKEFVKELTTFQEEFNKIEEGDEEAIKKRVDLWNTEIEVSFEPILLSKVEDLVPAKNDFGITPNYSELLEIIAE